MAPKSSIMIAPGPVSGPEARAAGPLAPFDPPRFLAGRHLQSMLPSLGLRVRFAPLGQLAERSRSEILTAAGARLHGLLSAQRGRPRGLVVLLHGWEGCVESHYMMSSGERLYRAGFDVFRLNFRDHGGTEALNPGLFHSCRIDEVVSAVASLSRRARGAPLFLVGFSLGGNFAMRVAVRAPAAGIELRGVVAVCPVLDPGHTMRALEEGLWVYRSYFLRRWRRSLVAKARAFPERYDFGPLERFSTLTETTEFFVRKYTEYPDLETYLAGYAVTGEAMRGLTVDTHVIAARDDPVIPSDDLARLAPSPALRVTLTRHGGHCGFINDFRLRSWVHAAVLEDLGRGA